MRGHGATLVAPSIKLAVFRAVYTKKNAEILKDLAALGGGLERVEEMGVGYLSEGECGASAEAIGGQVERAWEVWCRELEE